MNRISPARAHYERTTAQLAAEKAASGDGSLVNATAYELMLVKLNTDQARLKQTQSTENKAKVKQEVLPDYVPWVEGVIKADKPVQDIVLMTVMVWRIDAGDYPGAFEIAEFALRHKLSMPDQYKRTLGAVVLEEVAEAALIAVKQQTTFDVAHIERAIELTAEQDIVDEVKAKAYKALGLLLKDSDYLRAADAFRKAYAVDSKSGVKREIELLERAIKSKESESKEAETNNGGQE